MCFDLWRVRTAPQERLPETLAEAAFRIGQTLAEGLGDQEDRKAALVAALAGRALAEKDAAAALIDSRLAEGRAARGLALYRVARQDFAG